MHQALEDRQVVFVVLEACEGLEMHGVCGRWRDDGGDWGVGWWR